MLVSEKQVLKNRQGIKDLWKRIPAKWVNLDTFFRVEGESDKSKIARMCDGKDGPHNECGAVACFAGWSWTYHPYQQWCNRNQYQIASTKNLSIYLGLDNDDHMLFTGRQNEGWQTRKQEVKQRIKTLMSMPITSYHQVVMAFKKHSGSVHSDTVI